MSSITVGELKAYLEDVPNDYEVEMNLRHKYAISEEDGIKGWYAYINGIKTDKHTKNIYLMN